jgi:hypothetical protein
MANLTFNTFELSDFENAFNKALKEQLNNLSSQISDKDLKSRKETARILNISLPTLHLLPKKELFELIELETEFYTNKKI